MLFDCLLFLYVAFLKKSPFWRFDWRHEIIRHCLTFEFKETDHNNFRCKVSCGEIWNIVKGIHNNEPGRIIHIQIVYNLLIYRWYKTSRISSSNIIVGKRVEVSRTKSYPVILFRPCYLLSKLRKYFSTIFFYSSCT